MLRWDRQIILWLVILLLAGCQPADGVGDSATGEIVGVYDGDTCTMLVGKEQYKIRLEGIDTPEMDQAFGKNAKQALSKYVFGKQVTVNLSGQDRYQRYLGTLILDGQNINLQLVKDGCAWHYKEYSSDSALAQAESDARSARRGLWQDDDVMAPWEWRRKDSRKSSAKKSANTGSPAKEVSADVSHWLNSSSGIRHNRSCHQFGKSKGGRPCGPRDGRACKVCGG